MARTSKVWLPAARLSEVAAQLSEFPSKEHVLLARLLESAAEVVKVALLLLVGSLGPESTEAVGSVISTTHVKVAEALLPASSVAVTVKVLEPSATLV